MRHSFVLTVTHFETICDLLNRHTATQNLFVKIFHHSLCMRITRISLTVVRGQSDLNSSFIKSKVGFQNDCVWPGRTSPTVLMMKQRTQNQFNRIRIAAHCTQHDSDTVTKLMTTMHMHVIKQLLDEVEHDIMNYQNRGLCYLPKPKAEADNTDTRF